MGILSAIPTEIARLRACVTDQIEYKRGECFSFTTGTLEGRPVVFGARQPRAPPAAARTRPAASERGGAIPSAAQPGMVLVLPRPVLLQC